MKRTILFFTFALILLAPAVVLAQPELRPLDISQDLARLIDAIRTGSTIATAAAAITLLVSLFKSPLLGGLVGRIPAPWRIAIPIVLGGIAGILYDLLAAVPSMEAWLVGIFSGPVAVFGHELVSESVLGGWRTRHPHAKQG
jgi:hypothetical protein